MARVGGKLFKSPYYIVIEWFLGRICFNIIIYNQRVDWGFGISLLHGTRSWNKRAVWLIVRLFIFEIKFYVNFREKYNGPEEEDVD